MIGSPVSAFNITAFKTTRALKREAVGPEKLHLHDAQSFLVYPANLFAGIRQDRVDQARPASGSLTSPRQLFYLQKSRASVFCCLSSSTRSDAGHLDRLAAKVTKRIGLLSTPQPSSERRLSSEVCSGPMPRTTT
jgi:hypothetical protein